ncbi:uncharacterized protein LOC132741254 [Ruditapes philippinarum]|uniref:uncharacterized protein LOC132741254 n=1 Tax=Ruditapes philippinarum TaxID=129788 RepID=UPI00295B37D3|nr:uncharacterized protein LOC132741254 [Ruditapes philippinarum]
MSVPGKKASQKLLSTLFRGGAEDFDIFCEQCDRDDIRLPAFGYCVDCEEHLCKTCFNTHTRPKPLRHHQLLDKDHMPQKQDLQISYKFKSGGHACELFKPCNKHTKEVIKFYCHDHNTLICSVCVTLEHTPISCHVDYIPDISGQTLDSIEFTETLRDIDKLTDKCCQITTNIKQRVAKSTASLKDAIAEIENFRKEISKRLDELEMTVKDNATKIQQDNNYKLKTTETTCDDIKKSLQASADTLKQLNTNKKSDQLFTELKIAQQLIIHNVNITTQLQTTNDVDEFNFESNQAIRNLLQNETLLGTLIKKELRKPAEPKNKITPRKISAKTSSDRNDCWINGITVSHQNQLFVADYKNKSIKMIDRKSGEIKQLQLQTNPWDITMVTRDTLAVTLPDIYTIQFISFSSKSLSLKSNLKVDGECHGISHHQGKHAVTFLYPAKLQIMNLKGNIKITVEKDSNADSIFSLPYHVTTNSHSIYVSDKGKKEVIWFNWQGEMMGRNVDIESPRGISLIDEGSLFVSDNFTNCIFRVSGDCKNRITILEDVDSPEAICWCAETSTLCVCTNKAFYPERNHHIKLYKNV